MRHAREIIRACQQIIQVFKEDLEDNEQLLEWLWFNIEDLEKTTIDQKTRQRLQDIKKVVGDGGMTERLWTEHKPLTSIRKHPPIKELT